MTPAELGFDPSTLGELWPLLLLAYPHILARFASRDQASAADAGAEEKFAALAEQLSADHQAKLDALAERVAKTEAAIEHMDFGALHDRVSKVRESVHLVETHLGAKLGRVEGRIEASNDLLGQIHAALLAKVE